jgi:hypothetical protein
MGQEKSQAIDLAWAGKQKPGLCQLLPCVFKMATSKWNQNRRVGPQGQQAQSPSKRYVYVMSTVPSLMFGPQLRANQAENHSSKDKDTTAKSPSQYPQASPLCLQCLLLCRPKLVNLKARGLTNS